MANIDERVGTLEHVAGELLLQAEKANVRFDPAPLDHRITEQGRIADVRHRALVGMIQEVLDEIRSRSA
ncbi:hypothetical protein [Planotetraspora sp. GP83]|uniref:hypothetical protein n=1 Tax=Planotetraspora sp. GP83 TaxID=3156264 RepID=UPI003516A89F